MTRKDVKGDQPSGGETTWTNTGATRYGRGQHKTGSFGDDMLRPSPNHGTQRLPNDDDDEPTISLVQISYLIVSERVDIDLIACVSPWTSTGNIMLRTHGSSTFLCRWWARFSGRKSSLSSLYRWWARSSGRKS